jgi:DNA-binding Lrp family transcriptional regulator
MSSNVYVMREMEKAIVLINTKPGSEELVSADLKKMEGVVEVHNLYGLYDLIAVVEGPDEQAIKKVVSYKVRAHPQIASTLTMRVVSEH